MRDEVQPKMRAAFHTLGCKVNSYETQAVSEQFRAAGFEIVDFQEIADVYVINTCSVTQMAEHKSRQMINRVRKLNPDAIVIAAGCYAQRAPSDLGGIADIIVGNNNKSRIVDIALERIGEREAAGSLSMVNDLTHCRDYESQNISSLGKNVRAYVKIQDGCDRFCSYCVIPYVRGRSRCRSRQDILAEVAALAENGYKEIVLTGIDISTYNDLAALIRDVSDIQGIKRIRLGSLEAGVITGEFIREAAQLEKLCPQFHLSLQSGCAATLKRMNRHYCPEEFLKRVMQLKSHFETCAVTTDVIVGFPGESDDEFEESLSFIKECGFSQMHVFKYSRREGTVADRMPDQVPENIKNERSARLIAEADRMQEAFDLNLVGKIREVLVEERIELPDGKVIYTGFTPEYVRVGAESSADITNTIISAELLSASRLKGERALLGKIR